FVSAPRPAPLPLSLHDALPICRSDRGLDFQARHCDGSFLTAQDLPGLRDVSRDVRKRAAAQGRTIRTYSMLTVITGRTDADAERSEEHTSELQSRFDLVCRLLL